MSVRAHGSDHIATGAYSCGVGPQHGAAQLGHKHGATRLASSSLYPAPVRFATILPACMGHRHLIISGAHCQIYEKELHARNTCMYRTTYV